MSSFRTLPSEDPGVSRMEFDYYHKGSDAEFQGKTCSFSTLHFSLLHHHLRFWICDRFLTGGI